MKLWEAVALAMVAQATARNVAGRVDIGLMGEFWQAALGNAPQGQEIDPAGILDGVYRSIDESKVDEPYPVVLARELGLKLPSGIPRIQFPSVPDISAVQNAIILAPFGLRRDLELPLVVWRHVARFMRSYGRPVFLLGDRKSRLDIATFSEGDMLGRRHFDVILSTIKGAELMVGVPNEWTWMAASLNKKIALLYPDNQPPRRWFWFAGMNFGRAVFTPSNVQTPVILTAIRKLAEVL